MHDSTRGFNVMPLLFLVPGSYGKKENELQLSLEFERVIIVAKTDRACATCGLQLALIQRGRAGKGDPSVQAPAPPLQQQSIVEPRGSGEVRFQVQADAGMLAWSLFWRLLESMHG